jgi:hypothetical protein
MNAPSATPTGAGSLEHAPELPPGFARIFESRYIDAGKLRLHAVVGGKGPPLLLVHGPAEVRRAPATAPRLHTRAAVSGARQSGL